MANCEIFEAGDVALESGAVLPAVRIAYRTLGKMNAARSNAIAYPTHYSGTHDSNAWAIGPGMALDPEHYFIIVPNMLGNGFIIAEQYAGANDGPRFPLATVRDNILLQHRLASELFNITTLALVVGHSMGAQQQRNRVSWSLGDEADEEVVVPSGDFALEAHGVFAR